MSVAENIAEVRGRIATAARRVNRDPDSIRLMVVTKTFPAEVIQQAYDAGARLFGENRVQEFSAKAAALRDLEGAEWHLIGHLQSNKAAKAVEVFHAVDSVDSLRLAEKLNNAALNLDKQLPILIEINVGGEEAKSGIDPNSLELEELLKVAVRLDQLQFCGLMTIPPFIEDPQEARPFFRRLRELRDRIAGRDLPGINLDVLSMGMSHDFEVAIEEGSTCVRLGSAIFGERYKH
jgi:pyridoxal phosphate enzyme (YggS family)